MPARPLVAQIACCLSVGIGAVSTIAVPLHDAAMLPSVLPHTTFGLITRNTRGLDGLTVKPLRFCLRHDNRRPSASCAKVLSPILPCSSVLILSMSLV